MGLVLITGPSPEPVSLVEAKQYLRVDHDDDNTLISSLITSARMLIDGEDGWLGRALVTQTWELHLDEFPINEIEIPLPPLQSIVSIKYDEAGVGTETTLDPSQYEVDTASEPGWVLPVSGAWPSTFDAINAVRIRYIAGYGDPAAVPEQAKIAIKEIVTHLYENRGAASMPEGARGMLFNLRPNWVARPGG